MQHHETWIGEFINNEFVVFRIVLEIQKCELDVWNFTEKMDNISKNLQGRKKSFTEKFQERLKKKIKAIA